MFFFFLFFSGSYVERKSEDSDLSYGPLDRAHIGHVNCSARFPLCVSFSASVMSFSSFPDPRSLVDREARRLIVEN